MIKTSLFLGEAEHGRTVIPLFTKSDSAFEKTASVLLPDVVRYIETLKPRTDAQYVLVNAMGASEYWGSNVNGDAFPEYSLIHAPDQWTGNPLIDKIAAKSWPYGYPTFYNAHPYAHHRNKDHTRAFGDVELAAWNDAMKRVELVIRVDKDKCESFGGQGVWDKLHSGQYVDVSMGTRVPYDLCFPAGTLVRTGEGNIPIEQVKEGSFVITHTGSYRGVKQVMRRMADGLYRICTFGLPEIKATDNHPFLAVRREQVRTCKGSANGQRRRHTFKEGGGICSFCGEKPTLDLVWASAETLKPGDYLAVPTGGHELTPEQRSYRWQIDVSPMMARTVGYYLGDGYIISQRAGRKKDGSHKDMGFGFSVGSSEEAHLHRLLGTLAEIGTKNEPQVYEAGCGRKALIVSIYDQKIAADLQVLVGRGSRGKFLTEECYYWSKEAKMELVAGYIDTDGSFDEKSGQVRIGSVNRGLLLDVQRLLLTIGITATVCFAGVDKGKFSPEAGTESWYLCFSAAQGQKFLGRSVKIKPREVSWESPNSFFYDGYWLTPVSSIEEVEGEVEVFNLSVDVDESYLAEGRAVHNCSICTDWDAYKKAEASFHSSRHKHAGDAALEFHKSLKQRNGEGIRGLSITRNDYCEHAKTMMNKILPDGRKVFVINTHPRFFDISFVFIGADKTAKVMMKIAEDTTKFWSLPSAEIAEKLGYAENIDGSVKVASTDSEDDDVLKMAFLGKSAKDKKGEIKKDVIPSQFAGKAIPVVTKQEPELPDDVLDLLATRPLGETLDTTASMGMVLKPREFQRIVLIQVGQGGLANQYDRDNKVIPKVETADKSQMEEGGFNAALARLLLPFLAARSGFGPMVEPRALKALMGSSEIKETDLSPPASLSTPLMRKIGAAYMGYRQMMLEKVAGAQEMLLSSGLQSSTLTKLASAPADEVFTPTSVAYFKIAYWNEVGTV